MTIPVIVMIILGLIICIASYFVSENLTMKDENLHLNLMTVDEDYEFSDREIRIIKRKIEDVIANQAKDILYETNESLASMANEKTMALGDYAVTVCDEIEKNHKEVMFLYSMLDDKQKEIMKTVNIVDAMNQEVKQILEKAKQLELKQAEADAILKHFEQSVAKEQAEHDKNQKYSTMEQSAELMQKKKETDEEVMKHAPSNEEQQIGDESSAQQEEYDYYTEETDVPEEIEDVFAQIDQAEIDFDEVIENEFQENENLNDIILEMHRNGDSIIEIAKQLGLGVGEVKLVIDLYRGE